MGEILKLLRGICVCTVHIPHQLADRENIAYSEPEIHCGVWIVGMRVGLVWLAQVVPPEYEYEAEVYMKFRLLVY